jgi:hypothetical protein
MADYCYVDDVKNYGVPTYEELGFDNESDSDKFIQRLVSRASRVIDRYCNRLNDFFNGGSTVTDYFDVKEEDSTFHYPETERTGIYDVYRRTFRLSQSPIISVTTVHKNTANLGDTAVWELITAYYMDSDTGRIVIKDAVAPISGIGNMRVIYKAGYATEPDEIKWACEELVVGALNAIWQRSLNSKIRFTRPTPIGLSTPDVFTDAIKEKLAPYKKRRSD